jgi:hypothetical protein
MIHVLWIEAREKRSCVLRDGCSRSLLRMTEVLDGIKNNRHPEEARSAVSKDALARLP